LHPNAARGDAGTQDIHQRPSETRGLTVIHLSFLVLKPSEDLMLRRRAERFDGQANERVRRAH
jgi:hypothetical protein